MMNTIKYNLVYMVLLIVQSIIAQENQNFPPPENPQEILVNRTKGNISVNDQLNEEDWKKGKPVSNFFKKEPRQGGKIKYKTEVKFLLLNNFK